MYQRLTDAIRTVDTRSWIFVHPPNVASLGVSTRLGRIDDAKVVYVPHLYDVGLESGGGFDPSSAFHATWEAAATPYAAANQVPMMVGEWGLPDPEIANGGLYVERTLAVLERATSGWTVFTWNTGGGYGVLDEEGRLDPTWQRLVQAWPRAIAGAPTASHWDAEAATLRVTFDQQAGDHRATEIVVPAALYPDGVTVTANAEAIVDEDLASGLVTITFTAGEGERAVCVAPAGSSSTCEVATEPPPGPTDPPEEPSTDPDPAPSGAAPSGAATPPAVPVSSVARFTG